MLRTARPLRIFSKARTVTTHWVSETATATTTPVTIIIDGTLCRTRSKPTAHHRQYDAETHTLCIMHFVSLYVPHETWETVKTLKRTLLIFKASTVCVRGFARTTTNTKKKVHKFLYVRK